MIISENYKNNLKRLAGLLKENVQFKAIEGRSEAGTLSWYSEEYILNISEQIVNLLDSEIAEMNDLKLEISKSSTKISQNTFTTKLNIKNVSNPNNIIEFLLSVSVNFEQNSNTAISVTTKGVTNKFTMNSKHSLADIENIVNQTVSSFMNSITLINKG
jgi:hypothetical protein